MTIFKRILDGHFVVSAAILDGLDFRRS